MRNKEQVVKITPLPKLYRKKPSSEESSGYDRKQDDKVLQSTNIKLVENKTKIIVIVEDHDLQLK